MDDPHFAAVQDRLSPSAAGASRSLEVKGPDWAEVARLLLTSRALDELEEKELVPAGKVRYQFSARGHELAQILLGLQLDHPHDAAAVYYRSRPFMLASGLTVEEALSASLARAGGPSGGRDIGVVFSMPPRGRATVLPVTGDVGGQYTPAAGWAQSICYHQQALNAADWQGCIAAVMGGDGSVATSGFWSALNIASTQSLPMLFMIEDNGYAISVPSTLQVPGGDIATNLRAYRGIMLLDGDGTDPADASEKIRAALEHSRSGRGPALLRLRVPRLNGHSCADNQAYKDDRQRVDEWGHDPLQRLRAFMLAEGWAEQQWRELEQEAARTVREAVERAATHADPDPTTSTRFVFADPVQVQQVGGAPSHHVQAGIPRAGAQRHRRVPDTAPDAGVRVNMIDAIRRTLAHEMSLNPYMVIFGEDVGRKGGVHGATRGLQSRFGAGRVFDTSLNEEGIIGRAVGMALSGLLPVPEIQFRKYVDPATEQINDCGTMRWRTNNVFAAPVVVRIPVGFSKHTGDPWHSVCGEAILAHTLGWQIAFPSNAADATGLLRSALRGNNPVFFLEHRARLDSPEGRTPYPGDEFTIPFGQAALKQSGDTLSVITWGAMVQRCIEAVRPFGGQVEILDLRTIVPWDREAVLASVRKTGRCLVVHEDTWTAGFGAEIAATVAQDVFAYLDAPVSRLATPDCPIPYNVGLMATVIPPVASIRTKMKEMLRY